MKEKLLKALECCERNDACGECPMMEDFCDFPDVPFVNLPVPLVEAVIDELGGKKKVVRLS